MERSAVSAVNSGREGAALRAGGHVRGGGQVHRHGLGADRHVGDDTPGVGGKQGAEKRGVHIDLRRPAGGEAGWESDRNCTAVTHQACGRAWIARRLPRGKGHGRIERRTLITSTWLNDYLTDWPAVAQVFRLVRERTEDGETTVEVVYGITSGGRVTLDGERLLAVTWDHWGIENGRHYTRDETFREDRCRVRRGNAPRVLADLRNVAVSLRRNTDHPSVPAATRELAAFPDPALDLLKAPPSIAE